MRIRKIFFLLVGLLLIASSCEREQKVAVEVPDVNLNHLMHLYDVVDLPENTCGGIVHIYSQYPDYTYDIEPNEGFTCVDDVARAMMIDAVRFSQDEEIMSKYDFMAEFLLYMQNENGWFNNFIWHDLSINTTYRTSLAEPNWWSWRAFWALTNYESQNEYLTRKADSACAVLAENIFELYLNKPLVSATFEGIEMPTWMPLRTASDQAAVLILGMEAYYKKVNKDERALKVIELMADGVLKTQKGDANTFPYGAYLSWENLWHAYGNGQAYALLRAGQLLNRTEYTESALKEIDNFYPFLISENYLSAFSLKKENNTFTLLNQQQFAQIAYGIRPMVWGCMEAFKVSGEKKYKDLAHRIVSWLSGNNIANQQMYDPETGRCFDGIVSETEVNKNSGAESTIEALLSLQVFNQNKRK